MKVNNSRKLRAQGMVEFALALPLLLLVMLALIEFGRLLFIYSAVFTASREAARYGAATGLVSGNTAHFQDCAGMRASAKRIGNLVGISDSNIVISFDNGTGGTIGSCPVGGTGPGLVSLGDRIIVQVTATYRPLLPLVNLPSFPITSRAARTLLRNIDVQGTPGALPEQICVKFATTALTVAEADTSRKDIAVTINLPTDHDVIVPYTIGGTATPGVDYTISPASPLDIWSGRTSVNININVIPDGIFEGNETIVLTLGTPTNAMHCTPDTFTLTIQDDDPLPVVSFTSAAQSIAENAGSTFIEASLNTVSGLPVTVPYVLDAAHSTATLGSDYVFNTLSPIVIPAGQLSARIYLSVTDDLLNEDDETIHVVMGNPVNAVQGAITDHTVTILDNDPQPVVAFATDNQLVTEESGTVPVRVQLSTPSGKPVTVPYSLTGSATQGSDYTIQPSPLVIPAGQAFANIPVNILPDSVYDPNETITVTMGTPANAIKGSPSVHTIVIGDVAPKPYVYFIPPALSALESGGSLQIEVKLGWTYFRDVTVPFTLSGTAVQGVDYTISPNPVVIPAGSLHVYLTINIIDDPMYEPNETVVVTMGQPVNGIPSPGWTVTTATIQDNDSPPLVSFATASQSGKKDVGVMPVVVRLSAASGFDVTVPFTLSGTAVQGVDYTVTPNGSITIPAGAQSATININVVNNDNNPGLDKTVVLTLGTPVNATLGTPSVHTATILAWVCPTASAPTYDSVNRRIFWTFQSTSSIDTFNLTSLSISWGGGHRITGISFGTTIWSNLTGVISPLNLSGSPLWSGTIGSRQMIFQFSNSLVSPNSATLSATFQHCPALNGTVSY